MDHLNLITNEVSGACFAQLNESSLVEADKGVKEDVVSEEKTEKEKVKVEKKTAKKKTSKKK